MKLAHEDDRRKLYEFPVAKRLEAKKDCTIGGHYHKKKTEVFLLAKGKGRLRRRREGKVATEIGMALGEEYWIEPGLWHEFDLKAGSVLVCLATAEHDPADDHQ